MAIVGGGVEVEGIGETRSDWKWKYVAKPILYLGLGYFTAIGVGFIKKIEMHSNLEEEKEKIEYSIRILNLQIEKINKPIYPITVEAERLQEDFTKILRKEKQFLDDQHYDLGIKQNELEDKYPTLMPWKILLEKSVQEGEN